MNTHHNAAANSIALFAALATYAHETGAIMGKLALASAMATVTGFSYKFGAWGWEQMRIRWWPWLLSKILRSKI